MQLLVNTFPIFLLSIVAFYSLKSPLQKVYTFENSAKLWLIHITVTILAPTLLIFILRDTPLKKIYITHLHQFEKLRLGYGFIIALTYIAPRLLFYFLLITPLFAAILSYFLSANIIKRYENLIPAHSNDAILTPYSQSLSVF